LVFNMQAALRSKAQKPDLKGRAGMDEWTVTLTVTGTRHPAVFSYWLTSLPPNGRRFPLR
jgi:hypothetical protein